MTGGSSGIPQGRFFFCDPTRPTTGVGGCDADTENWYDITLNNGTTSPVFDPNNPNGGTYNPFDGSDRFNFAPYNLLLTPSKRKSIFTSISYDLTDNMRLHVKGAVQQPHLDQPGRARTDLRRPRRRHRRHCRHDQHPRRQSVQSVRLHARCGLATCCVVTRRPVEVGPRIFHQDVDTTYFNVGLDGTFDVGDRGFGWDVNYAHSENKATQEFLNGYNVAKMKLALGDPAICALVPGCTPLDLFGGQGRPMTQDQIDYIRTRQIDSSKQVLDLFQANLTGDMFNIGDRVAGFAAGVEHRRYRGDFNPDPLRQSGESQDSFAAPVSASYDVDEVYTEFSFPLLVDPRPQCRGPLLGLLDLRRRDHRQGRFPLAADRGRGAARHLLDGLPRARTWANCSA